MGSYLRVIALLGLLAAPSCSMRCVDIGNGCLRVRHGAVMVFYDF